MHTARLNVQTSEITRTEVQVLLVVHNMRTTLLHASHENQRLFNIWNDTIYNKEEPNKNKNKNYT